MCFTGQTLKGGLERLVGYYDDMRRPLLNLRCHKTLLCLASPLLDDLLESCPCPSEATIALETQKGSERLPSLQVDGSIQAWTEILAHLYSGFSPPSSAPLPCSSEAGSDVKAPSTLLGLLGAEFNWMSAKEMLPVLHKCVCLLYRR